MTGASCFKNPMTHETRTCSSRVESVCACNATAQNRVDSRHGVTFGDLGGVGLRRWPPEDHQLADAACEPQPGRDQQTPPTVQVVVKARRAEERIVQAELSGPDRGHR